MWGVVVLLGFHCESFTVVFVHMCVAVCSPSLEVPTNVIVFPNNALIKGSAPIRRFWGVGQKSGPKSCLGR